MVSLAKPIVASAVTGTINSRPVVLHYYHVNLVKPSTSGRVNLRRPVK